MRSDQSERDTHHSRAPAHAANTCSAVVRGPPAPLRRGQEQVSASDVQHVESLLAGPVQENFPCRELPF